MIVLRISLRLLAASALFVMGAGNAYAYLTPGDSFGVPPAGETQDPDDDIPVIPSLVPSDPPPIPVLSSDNSTDPPPNPYGPGSGGGGGPSRGAQDPNLVKTPNTANQNNVQNSALSGNSQETNGGTHNSAPPDTLTMPQVGMGIAGIFALSLVGSCAFFFIKKRRLSSSY